MKKLLPLTMLVFLTTAPIEAQDKGGRILEMIVRGIAHAVTSENGSHIVPPPMDYAPQPSRTIVPTPAPNRTWFQPPTPQPQYQPQYQPQVQTQRPRVIRQAAPPQSQGYQGYRHEAPAPTAPRTNGFSWFPTQSAPVQDPHAGHHHEEDYHGPEASRGPGWFQYQPPVRETAPPRYSEPSRHQGHDHRDRGAGNHAAPSSPVIAIRSQFQPFTILQGQGTTSRGTIQQGPNQGTIVWLRPR